MKIQTKIITVAGTVIMTGVIILALNPFQSVFSYKLQYLRQTAKEIAEALEKETPIRLTDQFYTNETSIQLKVIKPGEQVLSINLEYTQLIVPYDAPNMYIKGKPGRKFEEFTQVHVYVKDGFLHVDPKPVVQIEEESGGRTIYKITITLVRIYGDLKPGATLQYNDTITTVYERFYDYPGVAEVYIVGQKAAELTVENRAMLEVYVVVERWISQ